MEVKLGLWGFVATTIVRDAVSVCLTQKVADVTAGTTAVIGSFRLSDGQILVEGQALLKSGKASIRVCRACRVIFMSLALHSKMAGAAWPRTSGRHPNYQLQMRCTRPIPGIVIAA